MDGWSLDRQPSNIDQIGGYWLSQRRAAPVM